MIEIYVAALAGWFVADLFTAIFHFVIDNARFARDWPFGIGTMVREFKRHHDDPAYFLSLGFWKSSRETVMGGLACFLFWPIAPHAFVISLALGVGLCQEIHKEAHRRRPLLVSSWLQDLGLILPPHLHNDHHSNFDRSYAILNGWSNIVTNPLLRLVGLARAA